MISIQISGQYGDPRADKEIWPIQKQLNDLFEKNLSPENNRSKLMLSIVLRVSGKVRDFGGDGPELLKYLKKDSEVTVDYVIPESKWRRVGRTEIKRNLIKEIFACLELLVEKAETLNLLSQKEILIGEIKNVFNEVSQDVPRDA